MFGNQILKYRRLVPRRPGTAVQLDIKTDRPIALALRWNVDRNVTLFSLVYRRCAVRKIQHLSFRSIGRQLRHRSIRIRSVRPWGRLDFGLRPWRTGLSRAETRVKENNNERKQGLGKKGHRRSLGWAVHDGRSGRLVTVISV
jgi:hypothetical protein